MLPLPLVATSLLATSLLSAPAASAAGETCQERPATIVGAPGQIGLAGTEGADVIVTNGATSTDAPGGADLVCITGGQVFGDVRVDAGGGDDLVDASTSVGAVDVQLGAGRTRTPARRTTRTSRAAP